MWQRKICVFRCLLVILNTIYSDVFLWYLFITSKSAEQSKNSSSFKVRYFRQGVPIFILVYMKNALLRWVDKASGFKRLGRPCFADALSTRRSKSIRIFQHITEQPLAANKNFILIDTLSSLLCKMWFVSLWTSFGTINRLSFCAGVLDSP